MKSWLFGTLIALASIGTTVSTYGDSVATASTETKQTEPSQKSFTAININQADVDELRMLKGIGQAKAVRIIEYRRQHGPFQSINELTNIKGIGVKTIEKNRHLLVI